jgi:hypothetical protein
MSQKDTIAIWARAVGVLRNLTLKITCLQFLGKDLIFLKPEVF